MKAARIRLSGNEQRRSGGGLHFRQATSELKAKLYLPVVVDVLQRLAVDASHGADQAKEAEFKIVGQVAAKELRILEVGIDLRRSRVKAKSALTAFESLKQKKKAGWIAPPGRSFFI